MEREDQSNWISAMLSEYREHISTLEKELKSCIRAIEAAQVAHEENVTTQFESLANDFAARLEDHEKDEVARTESIQGELSNLRNNVHGVWETVNVHNNHYADMTREVARNTALTRAINHKLEVLDVIARALRVSRRKDEDPESGVDTIPFEPGD